MFEVLLNIWEHYSVENPNELKLTIPTETFYDDLKSIFLQLYRFKLIHFKLIKPSQKPTNIDDFYHP